MHILIFGWDLVVSFDVIILEIFVFSSFTGSTNYVFGIQPHLKMDVTFLSVPSSKTWDKKCLFLVILQRYVSMNIFKKKCAINKQKWFANYEASLHSSKIWWTLVHKRLILRRTFWHAVTFIINVFTRRSPILT